MNAEQNISTPNRIEEQINWYEEKSDSCHLWYTALKLAEIILAALIPVVLLIPDGGSQRPKIAAGLFGAAVSIAAGFNALQNYRQNWIRYRMACEALKHEKELYIRRCDPYDTDEASKKFTLRTEGIICLEENLWHDMNKEEPMKQDHKF